MFDHPQQLHTRLSGVLRSTEDEDGSGLNICLVLRSGSVVRRQRLSLGSWGNFRIRSTSFEISTEKHIKASDAMDCSGRAVLAQLNFSALENDYDE